MRKLDIELAVGLFIIIGIVCLGYLSIKLGKMEVFGGEKYEIDALFSNIGGLHVGGSVMIAGVEVGRIKEIALEDYQARVAMKISEGVKIQEDAIAAIKTKGLIGEKYIEISPGGSDKIISPAGRIRETLPAVDVEQLISKYAFGKIE
ncbi:MAG: outer membrane lipid asymmetry maintenance protein MlaD [Pseudomonadota bacterium]